MKITSIKLISKDIYSVDLEASWFEKLFNIKSCTEQYKATGNTFTSGGGYVYLNKEGNYLKSYNKIGIAIDKFRLKW